MSLDLLVTPTLIFFWLRRAIIVFAIAAAALAAVEWLRNRPGHMEEPGRGADYASALIWAGVAAIVTASVTTYWAYKRSCRM